MNNTLSRIGSLLLQMWEPEDRQWVKGLFEKRSRCRLIGGIVSFLGVMIILGAVGYDDALFEMGIKTNLFELCIKFFIGIDMIFAGSLISRLRVKQCTKVKIVPICRNDDHNSYRKSM